MVRKLEKSLGVRDVRETEGIKHYKAEIIQSQIKIQTSFYLEFYQLLPSNSAEHTVLSVGQETLSFCPSVPP